MLPCSQQDREDDDAIAQLFIKHGIACLSSPSYAPTSFRHTRKIFTTHISVGQCTEQASHQAMRDIARQLLAWLRAHDLTPYDTVALATTSLVCVDREWIAASYQMDLWGPVED